VALQVFGEQEDIMLRAVNVFSGFVVTGFCNRSQRQDGHVLYVLQFLGPLRNLTDEELVFVVDKILRQLEAQVQL